MVKILIIDDSPTEAEFVKKLLLSEGFEILWAGDANSGTKMAAAHLPDLILMDVVMPGMSGFQATRRIKSNPTLQHIPILMLTTKDQESDKVWGLRNGASKYMVKPPNKEELLANIRQLIK